MQINKFLSIIVLYNFSFCWSQPPTNRPKMLNNFSYYSNEIKSIVNERPINSEVMAGFAHYESDRVIFFRVLRDQSGPIYQYCIFKNNQNFSTIKLNWKQLQLHPVVNIYLFKINDIQNLNCDPIIDSDFIIFYVKCGFSEIYVFSSFEDPIISKSKLFKKIHDTETQIFNQLPK